MRNAKFRLIKLGMLFGICVLLLYMYQSKPVQAGNFIFDENGTSQLYWPFPNSTNSNRLYSGSLPNNPIYWNNDQDGSGHHHGADKYAQDWNLGKDDQGKEFMAPFDGIVIYSDYQGDYGETVVIKATNASFAFRIAHLDKRFVKEDDIVIGGRTPLGTIGNTGYSTGAHAHIALYKDIGNEEVEHLKDYAFSTAVGASEVHAARFNFNGPEIFVPSSSLAKKESRFAAISSWYYKFAHTDNRIHSVYLDNRLILDSTITCNKVWVGTGEHKITIYYNSNQSPAPDVNITGYPFTDTNCTETGATSPVNDAGMKIILPPNYSALPPITVRNTSSFSWLVGQVLAFEEGAELSSQKQVTLTQNVPPGGTTTVNIRVTTPLQPGTYKSYWRIKDSNGNFIGEKVWIELEVQSNAPGIGVGTGSAKLFTAANYTGTATTFSTGETNSPNATAVSLQMPDGWSVRTFRSDNYTGGERCWTGSVPNLQDHDNWQNAIQSMIVYNYNYCAGGQKVKLYSGANYSGSLLLEADHFTNAPSKNSYSLSIPSGWSVRTYDQDNRAGGTNCWSSSVPNLQDHSWHNQIASMDIYTTNQCADNSNTLKLCNFTGINNGCFKIDEDMPSLTAGGLNNDDAESIFVTGDWRAVLFHGENYEGSKQLFTSSDNDLSDTAVGNNQASSIQVRKVDPTRVILYDLGDLNGEAFPSDRTVINLENWFYNDKAESVRVDPGYEVILCTDANFRGICGRTNSNKNDLNDVAQGLRNNVSSVRVCQGACDPSSMVPVIAGPLDTASFLPGSDVTFNWVGNGDEYYIEYWGGDLGSTQNSNGIYGTTSWTKTGLPTSENPYYWHVRSWSPMGQTSWSPTYSFKVQDIAPKDIVIAGINDADISTDYTYTAFINPNDATNLNYAWSPTPKSGQGTANAVYNWTEVGEKNISLTVSNTGGNATSYYAITVGCADNKYKAEYYNNKTLSGDPIGLSCKDNINNNWGGSGPTLIPSNSFKLGTGANGSLNVPSGQTVYTDDVRSKLQNSADSGTNGLCVNSTSGFMVGDEILVLQVQGTGAGNYEFGKIVQINSCWLTLESNLSNSYVTPNSAAQVIKVPQYTNVTISGKLTAHPWDGNTGGVLAFRAKGDVTLNGGSIDTSYIGFRGGSRINTPAAQGKQGETITGVGTLSRMPLEPGAGGGGGGSNEGGAAAGGGSYRTPGGSGFDPSYGDPGYGASTLYGSSTLTQLFFGSSGGSGGTDDSAWNGIAFSGRGGNGGGITYIEANSIKGTGSILSKGEKGEDHDGVADSEQGGGGGGAGGSIKLLTDKINADNITFDVLGGLGGKAKQGEGGVGGSGGSYILYCDNSSINTLPGTSAQSSNCDKDNFSVRWTGDINFSQNANYRFKTWGDDGIKLWVDDTMVVDRWVDQDGQTMYSGDRYLTAGLHNVKMEYYESGGGARAILEIENLGLVNNPPVVNTIPGQTIILGQSFTTFDLDNYGSDPDIGDSITWSYSGNTNITVSIDVNKVVTLTAQSNWTGENNITFTATDTQNATASKTALFKVNPTDPCPGEFQAKYYNNKTLSGTPVLTRCEAEIENDWGGGGPGNGVNNDNFSVRWEGNLDLDAGDYTFGTASDDGVRLWLDNNLIIDNWSDHGVEVDEYQITLAEGIHTYKMEYYEAGGGAVAYTWIDFHGSLCNTPTDVFCAEYFTNPDLTGLPTYVTTESEVDNDWGGYGPGNGIPDNDFSARWKGSISFSAGNHTFTTASDDGIRVWLDGNLIIDNWDPHGYEEDQATVNLTQGYHTIKVEYYEYGGGAIAALWWN